MKLNKEAINLIYYKGIKNLPRNNWEISLLDVYIEDATFDDNRTDNIITSRRFNIKIDTKTFGISTSKKIKFKALHIDRIAYIRSALIKISKKGRILVSAGTHGTDELIINCKKIFGGMEIIIDHVNLTVEGYEEK